MRNNKGQSTIEMTFILPLLIMLASAMLFLAYAGWQDLKVQQAANLAARIEGQEKVGGGRKIEDINQENGFGPGISNTDIDPSINGSNMDIAPNSTESSVTGTVYDRMRSFVRDLFSPGEKNSVFVPAPVTGQNVDQINVYRTLRVPHIPFFTSKDKLPSRILLKGTAYGGEDPFMYALPRWGKTDDSGNTPEWRNLLLGAPNNTTGG
jgi:TadE-like protein